MRESHEAGHWNQAVAGCSLCSRSRIAGERRDHASSSDWIAVFDDANHDWRLDDSEPDREFVCDDTYDESANGDNRPHSSL